MGNQRPPTIHKLNVQRADTDHSSHGPRPNDFAEPALAKENQQLIAA